MGEISRKIGELGENISDYFFNLIGWKGISNLEFSCVDRKKHDCNKHGLDFFVAYKCPLENETLEIVFISVKYTKPDSIKSNFISYSDTLIKSSECFTKNPNYLNNINGFSYKKKRVSHLIFWLNHDQEDNFSISKSLNNSSQEIRFNFDNLYLIDNSRFTFIYQSINFAKSLFNNAVIEFVYPPTGLNESIDGGRILSGNILPIHLLNSSILPIKIIDSYSQKHLILFVNDKFDEEALKRAIGLTQNLTSGWCNKIIICFPDFQASKHTETKERVFMRFSENKFSDMLEVKSFNNSFKSLETNTIVNSNSLNESSPHFNIETMLPFGDQIRQLLIQSFIYKPDLQTLLNRRGVYIGKNTDKSTIIPLLTKTLISPSEFEFLRYKQNIKDSAERISNRTLNIKAGVEIAEVSQNIDFEKVIIYIANKMPNCQLINTIDAILGDNGTIRIPFQLNRQDLTRDWASPKSIHNGEVTVKIKEGNNGLGLIQFDSIYSTNETKDIAKQIIKTIELSLKNEGITPRDEIMQKMVANEFSNMSRNTFLLSFIETSDQDSIKFQTLTSIDFSLDDLQNQKLPNDLASMKDKLDESIFKGRGLEDIQYIKDKNYREYFIFHSLTGYFLFQNNSFKGKFIVEFGFLDAKGKDKIEAGEAEFEFKIIEIFPFLDQNLTTKENHELKIYLKEEFNKLRIKKAQNVERKIGHQLSILIEN